VGLLVPAVRCFHLGTVGRFVDIVVQTAGHIAEDVAPEATAGNVQGEVADNVGLAGTPAGGIAVEGTAEARTADWDSANGSDRNTSFELVNSVPVPLVAPAHMTP